MTKFTTKKKKQKKHKVRSESFTHPFFFFFNQRSVALMLGGIGDTLTRHHPVLVHHLGRGSDKLWNTLAQVRWDYLFWLESQGHIIKQNWQESRHAGCRRPDAKARTVIYVWGNKLSPIQEKNKEKTRNSNCSSQQDKSKFLPSVRDFVSPTSTRLTGGRRSVNSIWPRRQALCSSYWAASAHYHVPSGVQVSHHAFQVCVFSPDSSVPRIRHLKGD